MIKRIISELSQLSEVSAIVLGGSRASKTYDDKSDYDLYVYLEKPLGEATRKSIINPHVKYMEYSNRFWELEDDGILNDGIEIEFIYRDINTIENQLIKTINGEVGNGYSTCFIDNFLNSEILYEKDDIISSIRYNIQSLDFKPMFDKIVEVNSKLLLDHMPSLFFQIKKAKSRGDLLSINHRLTAYFEILIDILFAANHTLHPGEKRMMQHLLELKIIPKNFEYTVENILKHSHSNDFKLIDEIEKLSEDTYKLLDENGFTIKRTSYKNM